jgi:hypothetical protein
MIDTQTVTLYRYSNDTPSPYLVDLPTLFATIQLAAYRFWLSERRVPAAIIIPSQLAIAMVNSVGHPLVGGLRYVCDFILDDHTPVPMLSRDAAVDPLFQFI